MGLHAAAAAAAVVVGCPHTGISWRYVGAGMVEHSAAKARGLAAAAVVHTAGRHLAAAAAAVGLAARRFQLLEEHLGVPPAASSCFELLAMPLLPAAAAIAAAAAVHRPLPDAVEMKVWEGTALHPTP